MMQSSRSTSLFAPIVALLAAAGAAACGGGKPHPAQPVSAAYRPECPIDTIRVRLGRDTSAVAKFTRLAVSYDATMIPEFNDCQRFATNTAAAYGPLVGIFASDTLNQTVLDLRQLAATHAADRALPIAIILSFDGDYEPLRIKQGFDCLYLAADTSKGKVGPFRYVAWVVPAAADTDCARARNPTDLEAISHHLDVYPRDLGPRYKVGDYPEVARWDWDRSGRHQYIGIGCRERWCEIGIDFAPSPDYDDAAMTAKNRRKLQVKGWYDEEFLAVNDPTGTGLAPSPIFGTIAPEPGLEDLTEASYTGKWQRAARVYLSAALLPYQKKFGFTETPAPGAGHRYNAIAMCLATPGHPCDFGGATPPAGCDKSGGEWYARIQPAGPTARAVYRCVTRRTHPFPALLDRIAGTVRWRWEATDQNAWIACPEGCCEVVGED